MGIARSSCRRPWESVGRNAGGKGEARKGEARCSVLQGIPASHSSLLGDLALFCLFFILIFGLLFFLFCFLRFDINGRTCIEWWETVLRVVFIDYVDSGSGCSFCSGNLVLFDNEFAMTWCC